MKKLITGFLIIVSSGCTTLGNYAGDAADQMQGAAEFTLCRGITVGAWARAYAQSAEKLQAWGVLCDVKLPK
jgi:hypothetical protein